VGSSSTMRDSATAIQPRRIEAILNLDAFAGPTQRTDSRFGDGEKMGPATIT
jgi:hypothetical protein